MNSYLKICICYVENHLNMLNVTKNRLGIDWEFSFHEKVIGL